MQKRAQMHEHGCMMPQRRAKSPDNGGILQRRSQTPETRGKRQRCDQTLDNRRKYAGNRGRVQGRAQMHESGVYAAVAC